MGTEILIVADTPQQADAWASALRADGFGVTCAGSITQAIQLCLSHRFAGCVLVNEVQGEETAGLADWIRMRGPRMAIVMVLGPPRPRTASMLGAGMAADFTLHAPVPGEEVAAVIGHLTRPAQGLCQPWRETA